MTAALLAGLAATGLWLWQWERTARLEACAARGGLWNGPRATCIPGRGPILERDGLRRTQSAPSWTEAQARRS
jgi:hypothetical protein